MILLPAVDIRDGKAVRLVQGDFARETDLSPRTVEMHRAKLMKKFSASTSSELVHKLVGVAR